MLRQKFENPDYLKIARRTFRAYGIDINAPTTERKMSWMNIFLFCAFIAGIFIAIQMVAFVYVHRKDMKDVAQGSSLFIPWLLGIFKCSAFLWKSQEHIQLIKHLEALANKASLSDRQTYCQENAKVMLIANLYFYLAYIGITFLSVLPFFLMLINFCLAREFLLEPPYASMYFFLDYHYWPYYVFYTLSFFLFTCSVVIGSLPVDTLLLWYIQMLCSMFHVLYGKFKAVAVTCDLQQSEEIFLLKFRSAVNYHQHLISLIEAINKLFSLIMFLEVLGSCWQLCMFAFQCKSGPAFHQIPIIVMAITGMLLQLSIYCIGGQKIQNLSGMISDAIYLLFPWDKMTAKQKRWLLLPWMRSQRASYLATHFFEVNARLLLVVLKTTYSITALLTAVNEK